MVVPCLWKKVQLSQLLALLPGFRFKPLTQRDRYFDLPEHNLIWCGQTPISPSLNNQCFDRLNVYATHVRELLWTTSFGISAVSAEREPSRPTAMLSALTRSLLPNLMVLIIENNKYATEKLPVTVEWVKTLVLPANRLTDFYVDLNLTDATYTSKDAFWSLIDTILSDSRHIARLKLNIATSSTPATWYWNCFSPNINVSHNVTSLVIRARMLNRECLGWMAQMERLTKLRVHITDNLQPVSEIPQLEGIDLPLGSFPSLESLEVDAWVGFRELFSQLWGTPVVSNITELRILNQCRADAGTLSRIATKSPNLRDLQLTILADEFGVGVLSPLASLPLRSLTLSGSVLLDKSPLQNIAQLWPNIERLSLQRTRMRLLELPVAFLRLPRLKYLCFAPPSEFPPEVIDNARAYHPPSVEHLHVWRSRSLSLVVNYRWANRVARSEIEILAR
ncbi:hypothetical protein FRC09_014415 [Ceratobasidium sp. 395]|nr:hypothetical protein FRC09_014415 [Ceratobasidium sp. 395]